MNVLEKIIAYKKEELAVRKLMVEQSELEDSAYFDRNCLSLVAALQNHPGPAVIAGFKRKTPAKGFINQKAGIEEVVNAYEKHGACAVFVYTDNHFFGGNTEDIVLARSVNLPLIREDFIIDPYQVVASKAMGADAVVLIAACHTPASLQELAAQAKSLGLETVLEIHSADEAGYICSETDVICINNRNISNFEADRQKAKELSGVISENRLTVAGSGITDPANILDASNKGFKGFMISETFMKNADPGEAFSIFMKALNQQGK